MHGYLGHVFLVLLGPERGARRHAHYLELDQFIGPDWLVTVHGPFNAAVALETALTQPQAVDRRLETGRLHPGSAAERSFAVVTALTARLRDPLSVLTKEVWQLERRVTGGDDGDPEKFLNEQTHVGALVLLLVIMAVISTRPLCWAKRRARDGRAVGLRQGARKGDRPAGGLLRLLPVVLAHWVETSPRPAVFAPPRRHAVHGGEGASHVAVADAVSAVVPSSGADAPASGNPCPAASPALFAGRERVGTCRTVGEARRERPSEARP